MEEVPRVDDIFALESCERDGLRLVDGEYVRRSILPGKQNVVPDAAEDGDHCGREDDADEDEDDGKDDEDDEDDEHDEDDEDDEEDGECVSLWVVASSVMSLYGCLERATCWAMCA